ncbi:MAG: TIGR02281 family clan AA aspartic protease [Rickettsiales bacterium]|nr:TIGR02281 family clan AA aspartic protease [Rickettsiales bacterium]
MDFNNFNSSDWQNFSYSALLLIILTLGILTRREISFGKILQYLAIWSLISLFFIAIYSYRYQFRNFKDRIIAEINPATAKIKQENEIVINVSQDGHFYLNSKINGVKVRFMIDTGASDIVINLNDAKRIGADVKTLTFNKIYQTANGNSLGATINLEELEISGIKFKNLSASVNSGNMGVSLLGISFLKRLKKYEFYQDQLILTI